MKVSNGISIAVVVTLSSSMLPILIGVLVAPLAALNAEGAGTRAFRKLHS
ncbi:putative secreted protein [Corynebacterium diphtheriae BH8]|nr:putative secreted protein [Corynebacterium diphtheriae BH8]